MTTYQSIDLMSPPPTTNHHTERRAFRFRFCSGYTYYSYKYNCVRALRKVATLLLHRDPTSTLVIFLLSVGSICIPSCLRDSGDARHYVPGRYLVGTFLFLTSVAFHCLPFQVRECMARLWSSHVGPCHLMSCLPCSDYQYSSLTGRSLNSSFLHSFLPSRSFILGIQLSCSNLRCLPFPKVVTDTSSLLPSTYVPYLP